LADAPLRPLGREQVEHGAGLGDGRQHRSQANRAVTVPSDEIVAVISSPAATGASGPSAPERMTSPARSGAPYSSAVPASHASAASGSPRHAAPLPLESSLPSASRSVIVTSRGSKALSGTCSAPSTNTPV